MLPTPSAFTIHYSLNSRKVIDAVDLLREFMAEFMVEESKRPVAETLPSTA